MLAEMRRAVDHIFIWSDTRRSSQWIQLQTRRMIDGMHVIQEICLKVAVLHLRGMKPASWSRF